MGKEPHELNKKGDFINLGKTIKGIDVNLQMERIEDSLKLIVHLLDERKKTPPSKARIMLCSENSRKLKIVEDSEATFYLKFKKYFIKIFVGGKQIGIINLGLTKEY